MSTAAQPQQEEKVAFWHDQFAVIKKHPHVFWSIICALLIGVIFVQNLWLNSRIDERVSSRFKEDGVSAASGDLQKVHSDIESINRALTPIPQRINELTGQVGELKGRMDQLNSGLTKQGREQRALDSRIQNQELFLMRPDAAIAAVIASVHKAEKKREELPELQLAAYKQAALAKSAPETFWKVVSAIVNYESYLNQIKGLAPDPAKVSRPCGGLTNESTMKGGYNAFFGGVISNCVVDLDTQIFSGVTFKDSVVRYHGGTVTLSAVSFKNCRFVLTGNPPEPITPKSPQVRLLLAILESPISVHNVSTGG